MISLTTLSIVIDYHVPHACWHGLKEDMLGCIVDSLDKIIESYDGDVDKLDSNTYLDVLCVTCDKYSVPIPSDLSNIVRGRSKVFQRLFLDDLGMVVKLPVIEPVLNEVW